MCTIVCFSSEFYLVTHLPQNIHFSLHSCHFFKNPKSYCTWLSHVQIITIISLQYALSYGFQVSFIKQHTCHTPVIYKNPKSYCTWLSHVQIIIIVYLLYALLYGFQVSFIKQHSYHKHYISHYTPVTYKNPKSYCTWLSHVWIITIVYLLYALSYGFPVSFIK